MMVHVKKTVTDYYIKIYPSQRRAAPMHLCASLHTNVIISPAIVLLDGDKLYVRGKR